MEQEFKRLINNYQDSPETHPNIEVVNEQPDSDAERSTSSSYDEADDQTGVQSPGGIPGNTWSPDSIPGSPNVHPDQSEITRQIMMAEATQRRSARKQRQAVPSRVQPGPGIQQGIQQGLQEQQSVPTMQTAGTMPNMPRLPPMPNMPNIPNMHMPTMGTMPQMNVPPNATTTMPVPTTNMTMPAADQSVSSSYQTMTNSDDHSDTEFDFGQNQIPYGAAPGRMSSPSSQMPQQMSQNIQQQIPTVNNRNPSLQMPTQMQMPVQMPTQMQMPVQMQIPTQSSQMQTPTQMPTPVQRQPHKRKVRKKGNYEKLKVLTYNISFEAGDLGARTLQIIQMIKRQQYDLIGLQEVVPGSYQMLQQHLGEHYHLFQVFLTDKLPYGDCILCRKGRITIVEPYYYDYDETSMSRKLLGCELKIQNYPESIHLLSTNLESMANNYALRQRQFQVIEKAVNDYKISDVILLGDFNICSNREPVERTIKDSIFQDAWVEIGCPAELKYTYDYRKNRRAKGKYRARMDRIMYRLTCEHLISQLKLVGLTQDMLPPSDHFGLTADIILSKKRQMQ